MKELILDEATWRCGNCSGNSNNRRGEGPTRLLNDEGFMCCLGQFALQLDSLLKEDKLNRCSTPSSLNRAIDLLTRVLGNGMVMDSNLSKMAMSINDDSDTTIEQKVEKLSSLFEEFGYKIVFKRITI